jgi:hypothetical protein
MLARFVLARVINENRKAMKMDVIDYLRCEAKRYRGYADEYARSSARSRDDARYSLDWLPTFTLRKAADFERAADRLSDMDIADKAIADGIPDGEHRTRPLSWWKQQADLYLGLQSQADSAYAAFMRLKLGLPPANAVDEPKPTVPTFDKRYKMLNGHGVISLKKFNGGGGFKVLAWCTDGDGWEYPINVGPTGEYIHRREHDIRHADGSLLNERDGI